MGTGVGQGLHGRSPRGAVVELVSAVDKRDISHNPGGGRVVARTPSVQSVDRAMLLLRAVAQASDGDASAARLAETCGLARAHGLAHPEHPRGARHGRLRPRERPLDAGVGVVDLARSTGLETVIGAAHPVLERLSRRTGETAALAVPRLDGLTYVDEVVPPRS